MIMGSTERQHEKYIGPLLVLCVRCEVIPSHIGCEEIERREIEYIKVRVWGWFWILMVRAGLRDLGETTVT